MRFPSVFVPLLLMMMLGCPADPEPADTEGTSATSTSGSGTNNTDTNDSNTSSPTSGATSVATDSATTFPDPSTTFVDPCGTAGCESFDGGSTTIDCGTGDCCDVNPNFCPPTGTDTEGPTGTSSGTDGSSGS